MKKQHLISAPVAFIVISLAVVSASLAMPFPAPRHGGAAPNSDGRSVFLKYHCDTCHAVSTAGIFAKIKSKAPDLVNVTVRHDKPFVHAYIRKEQGHVSCPKVEKAHDGKLHSGGKFAGSKEEEDALVDWLDKQRD